MIPGEIKAQSDALWQRMQKAAKGDSIEDVQSAMWAAIHYDYEHIWSNRALDAAALRETGKHI